MCVFSLLDWHADLNHCLVKMFLYLSTLADNRRAGGGEDDREIISQNVCRLWQVVSETESSLSAAPPHIGSMLPRRMQTCFYKTDDRRASAKCWSYRRRRVARCHRRNAFLSPSAIRWQALVGTRDVAMPLSTAGRPASIGGDSLETLFSHC